MKNGRKGNLPMISALMVIGHAVAVGGHPENGG